VYIPTCGGLAAVNSATWQVSVLYSLIAEPDLTAPHDTAVLGSPRQLRLVFRD